MFCPGLEEQLQKAKQHVEQFKSMSEANETALGDLNKVMYYSEFFDFDFIPKKVTFKRQPFFTICFRNTWT